MGANALDTKRKKRVIRRVGRDRDHTDDKPEAKSSPAPPKATDALRRVSADSTSFDSINLATPLTGELLTQVPSVSLAMKSLQVF